MRCTTCRTYLSEWLREYKAFLDESVSYGDGGGVKEVVVIEDESLRAGVDCCLDKHSPTPNAKKSSSNKSSLFRSVFKPLCSPSVEKQKNSPFKFKPIRDSPYKRPTFIPKSKLQTITEESEELHEPEEPSNVHVMRKPAINTSFHEDFSMDEASDGGKEESSDDSDYEGWDDETTLVAKFQENVPESSSREKLAELAYQLEGPMQIRADQLKQHLAHTLAPATRKVKEVHKSLEQKADVAFGVGVLSFDDSCKKIEKLSLHDEDEIKDAYMKTQCNITEYFKQLKEAYQKRNQLWDQLREAVDKSASRTLASLATLPSEIDDAAASIEKKSKDVSKSTGKDSKAKLLRDLLAEM
ncbi:hypothetical protein ACEPAG_5336 [Sanghuangporus baumii]